MLESITLENFQKHRHLHIDFDTHITVLAGESDAGKSAVIRALYWIMTNQLRGDFFIHHEEDSAKATLHVDGYEIVREKGKGGNLYLLDNGTPYEAFGSGVPEDVAKIANVCRTNWQLQLDSPFLFSLSPGEVSRELNSVVNLDLIDSILTFLSSEQRKAKTSVQVSEERLEQSRKKRDDLKWVKEADSLLKELEGTQLAIDKEMKEINTLKKLAVELEGIDESLKGADETIMAIVGVLEAGNAYQETLKEQDALAALLLEIATIDKNIDVALEEVKAMEEELKEGLGGRCPVCGGDYAE